MPVSRSKAVVMARHHSSWTPQYITRAPCACAVPPTQRTGRHGAGQHGGGNEVLPSFINILPVWFVCLVG